MFRALANRVATRCADLIDELLVGDFDALEAESPGPDADLRYHLDHPHRQELRVERARRPGRVTPPPAHCISPARAQDSHERTGLPRVY